MKIRVSAILVALWFASAGVASAQVANTGTLQVVVQDSDGGRLPGVSVTAEAADTITRRTAVTDGQGVASLEALAPSTQYVITVVLSGFQDQARQQILVRAGQTTSLSFSLAIAGLTETVSVSAASPLVDVKSATSGQDITLQLTESLPTGRSYQSYLQLVPGVMPDDQTSSGNPAARSGLNYSDIARQPRHLVRQRLLLRRHQRHRPGHRHVRRQPEHRDHSGTEGHDRRHSGGIRRRARPDLERRHQVGQQHVPRLGELLLPEQQPGRREPKRRSGGVLDQGQRLHLRRPCIQEQGVVLRQLPLHEPPGRRLDARHEPVPAQRRQHPASGVCQGQLGDHAGQSVQPDLPQRPDGRSLAAASATSPTRATVSVNRAAGGTAATTPACGARRCSKSAPTSTTARSRTFRLCASRAATCSSRRTDARVLTDEQQWRLRPRPRSTSATTRPSSGSLQHAWRSHTFKAGAEWNRSDNFRDTLYVDSAGFTSLATGTLAAASPPHKSPAAAGRACNSTSRTPATSTA